MIKMIQNRVTEIYIFQETETLNYLQFPYNALKL